VYEEIDALKPDVVGLNILTPNRVSSFIIIDNIHKKYPNINIIIGGIHSSILYKQILKRFPFLIVVIGEGEVTTSELLEKLKNGQNIESVKGIAFVKDNTIILTSLRPLIENLDKLPFPKHEIFFHKRRTLACILTSRGCPFRCSFCVLDVVSRGRVRYRSIKNVIYEIKYLISNFPQLETIWIHDDNFLLSNKRAIEFCNEITKYKIKLTFICSGRFKPMSKKLVEALENAGFIQVLFGLESGSPKILKSCHKKITQNDVINAINILKDSLIEVTIFLIVGLYGENDITVSETISFVKKIQRIKYIYFDDIGILIIYPGTEIYSIAKDSGAIDDYYWLTDKPTPFFTIEHRIEKLHSYKERILNNIALNRIIHFNGFRNQITMLPYILKFFFKSTFFLRRVFNRNLKRKIPPKIYKFFKINYYYLRYYIKRKRKK